MSEFSKEDLEEALRAIISTIAKCEKVQPKLKCGTAQHTLLVRRIKALSISAALIRQELDAAEDTPALTMIDSRAESARTPSNGTLDEKPTLPL